MAGLGFEMTCHLRVRGPLAATEGSPVGAHMYWEMSEGTLDGPRLKARIALPGGDWFRPGVDGVGRPRAAETANATRFEDHYMRIAMRFDAGTAKYAWLNQNLFVAEGRLTGKDRIEYRIYRVT